ncbi:MAG: hypothetical protein JXJ22_14560 [Bacteroidales bacterium]|nr:hypothetical protein [Bacteroidales bacterium]
MRIKNLVILGFVMAVIFTACKKDDDGSNDPFDAKYNDLSVSENKANLEDAGIDFINTMEQMKDADAIKVAQSFSEKMNGGATVQNALTDRIFLPVRLLQDINSGDANPEEVLNSLKSTLEDPVEIDLESIWLEMVGKYTWDPVLEDWVETELTNAIVFEFPGLPEDTENTATLTINNFQWVNITNPISDLETVFYPLQLPTKLHVDLKYEGTTLSAFDFSASYQSDAVPTSFEVTWTVDAFSFSVKLTHAPYHDASVKYTFKHNSDILIEWFVAAEGNWTEDAINDPDAEVQDIIQAANAHFQIMNIKVAGMVDIQPLANTLIALDEQDDLGNVTDEQYATQTAAAINDNARLVVVYADSNEKIAEAEAYAYYDDYYDEWWVDMRFVFADGSKVDAETYFSTGFGGLVNEINTFIAELNTEYDLGIDPIEY